MRKYDLIVFDLDGTLLDTSEGIVKSAKYAISTYGLPMPSESRLRSFIGPPIQKSFKEEFGLSSDKAMEMANCFRDRYKEKDLLLASCYPQIAETLRILKTTGCMLAVATNKREDYAIEILDHFGLLELVDAAYGTDFEGTLTKADLIEKCMKTLSVTDGKKAIMVGDTEGDRLSAQAAEVRFMAVTYGFGYKPGDTIEGCDAVANMAPEIVEKCTL